MIEFALSLEAGSRSIDTPKKAAMVATNSREDIKSFSEYETI